MRIQLIRGCTRVLLLTHLGFSMTGNQSLANRTKACSTYLLCSLKFFLFCRGDYAIGNFMYLIQLKGISDVCKHNFKTISLLNYNRIRKELGFVDFLNPNKNISKNLYYTQSVYECCVEQKSHYQLAKMPKMNIVKHLRNTYIN